ncbi:hypothetical protein BWI15_01125 [Kribbella sp. ALI-6-A]|uniref:SAM-dependent methyltransferase n=1 Tax=Kribbella sp. ALI-6-A TaxID=1933817 RepID=UPI00097C1BEC|nr:SAM-dependent methyltransferase [Kribbella sp. ALI-6-A]ONI78503.1 hypothetical protein BWI15_01125 [Kribbella sp. ALI-6-A]
MEQLSEPPLLVDVNKPSSARVHDVLLGGKNHYESDRILARQLLEIAPGLPLWARENRRWLHRVVSWLAREHAVGQFIDLGVGLPTEVNLHELVPGSKVVYVDNDPTVVAHGRALLAGEHTAFVAADLTRPHQVLSDEAVIDLDPHRPIALIESLVLHHVPGLNHVRDIQAAYLDTLPSGSFVAISHACNPRDGSATARLADAVEQTLATSFPDLRFRTPDEILSLFGDLPVLAPGLVRVAEWDPSGERAAENEADGNFLYCAVARKP